MTKPYRPDGVRLAERADELWDQERALIALVATRVREVREAQGLTLLALQERAGIGYRKVILLEQHHANITLRTLARLAAGLGVPPHVLLEESPKSGVRPKE